MLIAKTVHVSVIMWKALNEFNKSIYSMHGESSQSLHKIHHFKIAQNHPSETCHMQKKVFLG